MPLRPDNFRRGEPLRAEALQRLADGIRSDRPKRMLGRSIRRTRFGWSAESEDPGGGGIYIGVITTTITARTGAFPSFVLGIGTASIFRSEDGTTVVEENQTVFSTFRDPIPASTEPAVFGMTPDGRLIYLNSDC